PAPGSSGRRTRRRRGRRELEPRTPPVRSPQSDFPVRPVPRPPLLRVSLVKAARRSLLTGAAHQSDGDRPLSGRSRSAPGGWNVAHISPERRSFHLPVKRNASPVSTSTFWAKSRSLFLLMASLNLVLNSLWFEK